MRPRRREGAKTDKDVARASRPCPEPLDTGETPVLLISSSRLSSRLRVFAVALLLLISASIALATEPFILGADISWVPEDEADGATYFDGGVQKDIFQILHDHKFNYIRLRVFVDPHAPHGYAAEKAEAFCDLA